MGGLIAFFLLCVMAGCTSGNPELSPAATASPATVAGGATPLPAPTAIGPTATLAPVWTPSPTATALSAPAGAPAVTPTVTPILVAALPATATPLPAPATPAATINFSVGALAAVMSPTPAPGAELPITAHLENGFLVSFLGAEAHGDGSSTWRYRVERQAGAKKLQVWGLALPDCVEVLTSTPEGWEIAHAEDAPAVWGVSWKTKGNFQHGEFAVTLRGHVTPGTVAVAAIGPKLAAGAITGPQCQ